MIGRSHQILAKDHNLIVRVDPQPIGGYRGQVGALVIEHQDQAKFTDWTASDLDSLAILNNRILSIREKANIDNNLFFAKQDSNGFKLSLIPYPTCSWIEKIQGLIHTIFGAPKLSKNQVETIHQFYSDKFSNKEAIEEEKKISNPQDVFCNPSIISKQIITNVPCNNGLSFDFLHDNRPKGASLADPHFLMVPQGKMGHTDGSSVPRYLRFKALEVMKEAAVHLCKEFSTILFIERNGAKLQGVHHKNFHLIGIKEFPNTFFSKVLALFRQLFPPRLSDGQLQAQIKKYQSFTI